MSDEQNIVYEFSSYLANISGVKAYIDKVDPGASELPMWNIELDPKWDFSSFNDTNNSLNLVVKVSLIVDIKSSYDALVIMFRTLKLINQFDWDGGSRIGSENEDDSDTGSAEIKPEKTENNLVISFPYLLKTML